MQRRREPKSPDAVLDQLQAGADAKTAFDPRRLSIPTAFSTS